MNTSLFSKTPAVTVLDNRGLSVRSIAIPTRRMTQVSVSPITSMMPVVSSRKAPIPACTTLVGRTSSTCRTWSETPCVPSAPMLVPL
ncbi:insecticidal toxin [Yersinia pseudotuberculosis]|nr:insecticidal toxin [Yersinia pseudotuberculosis]